MVNEYNNCNWYLRLVSAVEFSLLIWHCSEIYVVWWEWWVVFVNLYEWFNWCNWLGFRGFLWSSWKCWDYRQCCRWWSINWGGETSSYGNDCFDFPINLSLCDFLEICQRLIYLFDSFHPSIAIKREHLHYIQYSCMM